MNSQKMIKPPALQKGDAIGIVAPARKITKTMLLPAIEMMKKNGYKPVFGKHLFSKRHQFAGTDAERTEDFQQMIENPTIKAIFAARGGYGCVRIVDKIDFIPLIENPKWIVGYSDLTVFHNHLNNMGLQTLHATMPVNFQENSPEAFQSLFDALQGEKLEYVFVNNKKENRLGIAEGKITGGNLSVLFSLLGSTSFPDTDGKILFLEDFDEHLYHIDRMMMAIERAGALEKLAGLVVGSFIKMHNRGIPFGKTAYEIIAAAVENYNYPVAYGFPAGHQPDNRTLIMGGTALFETNDKQSKLTFI